MVFASASPRRTFPGYRRRPGLALQLESEPRQVADPAKRMTARCPAGCRPGGQTCRRASRTRQCRPVCPFIRQALEAHSPRPAGPRDPPLPRRGPVRPPHRHGLAAARFLDAAFSACTSLWLHSSLPALLSGRTRLLTAVGCAGHPDGARFLGNLVSRRLLPQQVTDEEIPCTTRRVGVATFVVIHAWQI